jgi:polar amino acid transport system permease protein
VSAPPLERRRGGGTDLPVLLPFRPGGDAAFERRPRLCARHGLMLALAILVSAGTAGAQAPGAAPSILATLWKWTPLLLSGFLFNLAISVLAMAIGTALGALLGIMQISLMPPLRIGSWFTTQFFRNAPWLVLLFYCTFMLPFEVEVGPWTVPLPDWIKATLGLSLPVMANVSELVRGGIQSIPYGQWEAAGSLGLTRRQTIWMIILPQCVKRMLPPWMNLYAILTMATVLASIVGVNEVMTLTGQVLAAEGGRPELLVPIYAYVLLLFFAYCYPIALWTVRLERRFAVIG